MGWTIRSSLLEPGENLALAGRNLAADQATGELLLMLDDDAYPLPGAIETLVEAFRADPKLGVAGGFVRDIDPDGNTLRATELGTFDWLLRGGRKGEPAEGFPAFSFPEGACMIRRSAYLEVGGFFEPYFLTSSEIDLAARMLERGWDVRYFPGSPFDHMKAESERQTADVNLYYRIRNHLWYIWLRFPGPTGRAPYRWVPRFRPDRVHLPRCAGHLGAGRARRVAPARPGPRRAAAAPS